MAECSEVVPVPELTAPDDTYDDVEMKLNALLSITTKRDELRATANVFRFIQASESVWMRW